MYPDIRYCTIDGKPAAECVDQTWYRDTFIPTVGKRGAAIIEARGASSAASAASAAIDHMHDWFLGSNGDWVTMGVPSDGSYGIPEGLVCGMPCICDGKGNYEIVQGLNFDAFSQENSTRQSANSSLKRRPFKACSKSSEQRQGACFRRLSRSIEHRLG